MSQVHNQTSWTRRQGSCFKHTDIPDKIVAVDKFKGDTYYLMTFKPDEAMQQQLDPEWVNDWIAKVEYPHLITEFYESLISQTLDQTEDT